MPHELLLRAIHSFQPTDTREQQTKQRMLKFATSASQPFDRRNIKGHFTASGLLFSPDGAWVCLGFHRKLSAWLQFGGHAEDGECDPFEIALRETREESGLRAIVTPPTAPAPFDLDIHTIPPYRGVPFHNHFDTRYLFIANPNLTLSANKSEHDVVRWFPLGELSTLHLDASLMRTIFRAQKWFQLARDVWHHGKFLH